MKAVLNIVVGALIFFSIPIWVPTGILVVCIIVLGQIGEGVIEAVKIKGKMK